MNTWDPAPEHPAPRGTLGNQYIGGTLGNQYIRGTLGNEYIGPSTQHPAPSTRLGVPKSRADRNKFAYQDPLGPLQKQALIGE